MTSVSAWPIFFLNEVIPNQIADGFRAILVALTADASIERLQQIILE